MKKNRKNIKPVFGTDSPEYQQALDDVRKTNAELQSVLKELNRQKEEYNNLINEVRALKKKMVSEYKNIYK